MDSGLVRFFRQVPGRPVLPLGIFPGLELTGAAVNQLVSDPVAQAEAAMALREHTVGLLVQTAMDLSVEAEAYGAQTRLTQGEIPTVLGRRVTSVDEIEALPNLEPGEGRTRVYLEAAQILVHGSDRPVLGGMIGPFSLAGRLFGMTEAFELSIEQPEALEALLENVTQFLTRYALAFRETGVQGIIIAEPAAGLLSPRAMARFSVPYLARIREAAERDDFTLILHNCGARLAHLGRWMEAGYAIYHYGAPMDLPAAFAQAGDDVILAGNLDPSAVFYSGTPESVREAALALVGAVGPRRNFILSSGCDLPPGTPLENIQALMEFQNR